MLSAITPRGVLNHGQPDDLRCLALSLPLDDCSLSLGASNEEHIDGTGDGKIADLNVHISVFDAILGHVAHPQRQSSHSFAPLIPPSRKGAADSASASEANQLKLINPVTSAPGYFHAHKNVPAKPLGIDPTERTGRGGGTVALAAATPAPVTQGT